MNAPNPIDDLFRQRLEGYELESPMELFAHVAAARAGRTAPVVAPPARHWPRWSLLLCLGLSASTFSERTPISRPAALRSSAPIAEVPSTTTTPAVGDLQAVRPTTMQPAKDLTTATNPRATLPAAARQRQQALVTPPRLAATPTIPAAATPAVSLSSAVLGPEKAEATPIPANPAFAALALLPGLTPTALPTGAYPVGFKIVPLQERGWKMYLELGAGPEYYQRELLAKAPAAEEYRQMRENTETLLVGTQALLRFSMISQHGVVVRSGLQWSQQREDFVYPLPPVTTITLQPQLGPNGQVLRVDTLRQTVQQTLASRNRFTAISIPVVLGYERQWGDFTLALNGGVLLNMAFNQQGSFLAPNDFGQTVNFSSNRPDAYPAFRNRLGVGAYASATLSYPVLPGLRVVVEPFFRWGGGSVTAPDYLLAQNYRSQGITLGVRKRINKMLIFAKP